MLLFWFCREFVINGETLVTAGQYVMGVFCKKVPLHIVQPWFMLLHYSHTYESIWAKKSLSDNDYNFIT